jgi:hypothetical protein
MKRLLISAVRNEMMVHFQVLPHPSMSATELALAVGTQSDWHYAKVMPDGWVHIRNVSDQVKWNSCECCSQQFIFLGKWSRFCCDDCRIRFHRPILRLTVRSTCMHCEKSYQPKRKTSRYCSVSCRVAAHRKAKQDNGSRHESS